MERLRRGRRWRVRVFDHDDGGALVSLVPLLRSVLDVSPELARERWEAENGVWGYGDWVCTLEKSADAAWSPVDLSELVAAHERGEYLCDGRFRSASGVEVAYYDSAFLELVGSRDLVEQCATRFSRTEVEKVR